MISVFSCISLGGFYLSHLIVEGFLPLTSLQFPQFPFRSQHFNPTYPPQPIPPFVKTKFEHRSAVSEIHDGAEKTPRPGLGSGSSDSSLRGGRGQRESRSEHGCHSEEGYPDGEVAKTSEILTIVSMVRLNMSPYWSKKISPSSNLLLASRARFSLFSLILESIQKPLPRIAKTLPLTLDLTPLLSPDERTQRDRRKLERREEIRIKFETSSNEVEAEIDELLRTAMDKSYVQPVFVVSFFQILWTSSSCFPLTSLPI
jgi:hypothetical protein